MFHKLSIPLVFSGQVTYICLTQHARIHTPPGQQLPSSSLLGAVESVLDFCLLTQCAFSVKERLFNGRGAWVRIPQMPHFLENMSVKHYTIKDQRTFL